jgi:hypothetical protein
VVRIAGSLLLALTLGGTLQAAELLRQALAFDRVGGEVARWGRHGYRPAPDSAARTGRAIEALLARNPAHPDYLELYASYAAWRAHWASLPAEGADWAGRAARSQRAAVQARPAHRAGWERLAEYAARSAGGGELRAEARARLQALSPLRH